jgi:uncharacterized membrane protein
MSVEEAFKLVISAGVVTPDTVHIKEDKWEHISVAN